MKSIGNIPPVDIRDHGGDESSSLNPNCKLFRVFLFLTNITQGATYHSWSRQDVIRYWGFRSSTSNLECRLPSPVSPGMERSKQSLVSLRLLLTSSSTSTLMRTAGWKWCMLLIPNHSADSQNSLSEILHGELSDPKLQFQNLSEVQLWDWQIS